MSQKNKSAKEIGIVYSTGLEKSYSFFIYKLLFKLFFLIFIVLSVSLVFFYSSTLVQYFKYSYRPWDLQIYALFLFLEHVVFQQKTECKKKSFPIIWSLVFWLLFLTHFSRYHGCSFNWWWQKDVCSRTCWSR